LQAYQLLLQAKSLCMLPTETNVRASLELVADALRRDPGFARAWQGIACIRSYYSVAMQYSIPDALRDAESDAQKALILDPTLSGARAVLGFISACRGNWAQAHLARREGRPADAASIKRAVDPLACFRGCGGR
jgi:hypothetical protein